MILTLCVIIFYANLTFHLRIEVDPKIIFLDELIAIKIQYIKVVSKLFLLYLC